MYQFEDSDSEIASVTDTEPTFNLNLYIELACVIVSGINLNKRVYMY